MRHDIGNIHQFLEEGALQKRNSLAYCKTIWPDFKQWKAIAIDKVFELLHYFPFEEALEPRTLSISESGGIRKEEIEFHSVKQMPVRGILLIPQKQHGPLPAIVALHDHGGFYYFGREKIIEYENEPGILTNFKKTAYGGRSWATELAKRGYVVFVIDAFYFGTRRIDHHAISDIIKGRIPHTPQKYPAGSDDYIKEYNLFCEALEAVILKHILVAGATWPGILFHDDRRSLDYLLTREEVDPDRIGCCGLSIGGFRSIHLAALDSRIKCAVVVGWMSTYRSLLMDRLRDHTYMIYIPGLTRYLDLPDVMSLTAPNPLLVQQCLKDPLYNIDGMRDSCQRIQSIYDQLGHHEKHQSTFYDTHHEFNLAMQEEAFLWLDRWLK